MVLVAEAGERRLQPVKEVRVPPAVAQRRRARRKRGRMYGRSAGCGELGLDAIADECRLGSAAKHRRKLSAT